MTGGVRRSGPLVLRAAPKVSEIAVSVEAARGAVRNVQIGARITLPPKGDAATR
jgi:hypothetical protein